MKPHVLRPTGLGCVAVALLLSSSLCAAGMGYALFLLVARILGG